MTQLFSDTSRNRQIGIALVTLTTIAYATLDASAKWLVQSLPVLQVVWLRFLVHTVFHAAVFTPSMGERLYKVRHVRMQLIRGLMLACMTLLNFWALQYLQLAQTGAIQFSVPILIAMISAIWLGEHLDVRRWLAILLGFVGVLIIIRPGSHAFHPAILLSLGNAVLYAIFNMLTRHLAATENPVSTQFFSAMVAATVLTPFALWHWQTPEGWLNWALVGCMGLFGGLGHIGAAVAHRYASAAVLGPFLYQQIIYMTFWGWLLFDQMPDHAVAIGACVVVASGLYLLWRELRHHETSATHP
jgi:drug/metabolite transporter (DMT)-like permease